MELSTRYLGEESSSKEFLTFILNVNKTIKLHTLFTKSGLEYIFKEYLQNPDLVSYLFDLTDSFRMRLITLDGVNLEEKLIKDIASRLNYTPEDQKMCLLSKSHLDSFSTKEDIEQILTANPWLITIVMMRFCSLDYTPLSVE